MIKFTIKFTAHLTKQYFKTRWLHIHAKCVILILMKNKFTIYL